MEQICPKCGALSGSKKFFGDFCEDCYLGMLNITFPMRIEIPICRICGKVGVTKWEELNKTALDRIVRKNAKGRYERFHVLPLGGEQYEVVFLISDGPNYFETRRKFSLKMKQSVCDECSRATSGYYEAIVQIRGKNVERCSKKILRELRGRTFVSRYLELGEGVDVYVGSKKAVAEALGALKLKPKISDKLYGVKDGRRVYRRTYCVRV